MKKVTRVDADNPDQGKHEHSPLLNLWRPRTGVFMAARLSRFPGLGDVVTEAGSVFSLKR